MTAVNVPHRVGVSPQQAIETRLDRMAAQLDQLTAELVEQRRQREVLTELLGELTQLTGPALGLLTQRLAQAEERGYVAFARQGAGIVDRVVTSFGEDDVEALGDNVVLILETLREMTQPDVMQMLRQTAHLVNEPPAEPAAPPSLLALARELREPEVRRGLSRVLSMVQAVGERPHSHGAHPAGDHEQNRPADVADAGTRTDQEVV